MSTPHRAVIGPSPENEASPPTTSTAISPLSKGMAVFTLITLVGVTVALYYAWQHWQGARSELASLKARAQETHRVQQTLLETINSTRQALTTQQESLAQQQDVLDQRDEEIPDQQQSIATRQPRLHEERRSLAAARSDPERRFARASRHAGGTPPRLPDAETISLLRTAANDLESGRDRDTVLKGLRRAEALLEQAGESHEPARALLAEEIRAVEAFQPTDVQQLATAIRALQRDARMLPLKGTAQPPPAQQRVTSPPSTLGNRAHDPRRRTIGRNVRTAQGSPTAIRNAPRQYSGPATAYENWLRQTLRMRLDNARIGALSRNGPLYLAGIETSADLIRDVYANGTAQNELLAKLAALAALPLNPEPPEIGASLEALESLRPGPSAP